MAKFEREKIGRRESEERRTGERLEWIEEKERRGKGMSGNAFSALCRRLNGAEIRRGRGKDGIEAYEG